MGGLARAKRWVTLETNWIRWTPRIRWIRWQVGTEVLDDSRDRHDMLEMVWCR